MDPVSSHSHFDDFYYSEHLQSSDSLTWGSSFEESLKSKYRTDPLEMESLFNMANPKELTIDQGLPTNISLQQFANDFFEETLSNSPSLSTSLNSTPLSNDTPMMSSKQSFISFDSELEKSNLFPGVLATNPEMSASCDVVTLSQTSSSIFNQPLDLVEYTSQPLLQSNLSVNSSPYNSVGSPDAFVPTLSNNSEKPRLMKTKSKSISGSSSKRDSVTKSRNSLDSRLSLQRLGEVLKTKSQEDTVTIEKFILKVFGQELGFPLGYKTWIRDTSESYREVLLEELHKRVSPVYPEMTKNLLETVIRRATYSMMQGRLRKERRAASKNGEKKEK